MSWVNSVWCAWNIDFIAILCHWPPATELLFLVSHSLVITKPWRKSCRHFSVEVVHFLCSKSFVSSCRGTKNSQSITIQTRPIISSHLRVRVLPLSHSIGSLNGVWRQMESEMRSKHQKKNEHTLSILCIFFFLFVFSFSHLIHRIRWMNNLIALSSLINVSGAHGFGCFSFSCFLLLLVQRGNESTGA